MTGFQKIGYACLASGDMLGRCSRGWCCTGEVNGFLVLMCLFPGVGTLQKPVCTIFMMLVRRMGNAGTLAGEF